MFLKICLYIYYNSIILTFHYFLTNKHTKTSRIVLLILVAIAIGTLYWWLQLAHISSRSEQTRRPKVLRDFAEKVSMSTYDVTGVLANTLLADKMTRYLDTEIIEVQKPWLQIFAAEQPNLSIMANFGRIYTDKSIIELISQAHIQRDKSFDAPEMKALSEYFKIFINEDVITTSHPVELIRGKSFTKADGMNYNNVTRRLDLYGKVRGSLVDDSSVSKGS